MSKHTPRPWTAVTGLGAHNRDMYIRAGERRPDGTWPVVAKCCSTAIGARVVVEANAALIAAAPDLLAACKGLRAVIHDYMTHAEQRDCAAHIEAADKAIAAAGGAQ